MVNPDTGAPDSTGEGAGPASGAGVTNGAEVTSEPDDAQRKSGAHEMLAQMGGVSGLIYSTLPVLVFVPVSSAFGLTAAIAAALSVAALVLIWRLIRRESVQPAVSGFFGVGICALIAYFVGESKGYFLLGIWSSLFWASVFTLSVLFRRPLVGYIWGWVNERDRDWRTVRKAVLAFDIATITWVLVFTARFIVQRHLYDTDQTGWLATARIAMGWPLTAVAALATYLAIRAAQRAVHAKHAEIAAAEVDSVQVDTATDATRSADTRND